jgi:hypothetical protein
MALVDAALATVTDAALGMWLGSMVFFSFLGAPQVFAVLDDARAGRVVNAIFPRYYVFGVALGLLALLAGAANGALGGPPAGPAPAGSGFGAARVVLLVATLVGVALHGYARWVLIPKMEAAGDDAFEQYHQQSVTLNGVAMLAVALALVASHLA